MAATVPPQQVTAAQKLAQVNEQTWLTMGKIIIIKKNHKCCQSNRISIFK